MDITRKNKIIFILGFIILALLLSIEDIEDIDVIAHNNTYINATTITGFGFSSDSGNNTSLISEMNTGMWQGLEQNPNPWYIYIYYYNVSHFDMVESLHKYNSTSGTPSSHLVQRLIWCTTHNDWVALEEFSNEDTLYYHVKDIPDDDHYIYPNGTVIMKYQHLANGISTHIISIDVSRLVVKENTIVT